MSPSNNRIHFHVYVCEWGILLTLVLVADNASLSLEHQPCLLGSSGHHPKPTVVFLADAQTPLTCLKARSWPWPLASALGKDLAATRCGKLATSRSHFNNPDMVPSLSHGSYANLPLPQQEIPAHPSSCSSMVHGHAGTEPMGSCTVGLCSTLGFEPGIIPHQAAGRMHLN